MKTALIGTSLLLASCSAQTTLQLDTLALPATGPGTYALWLEDSDGAATLLGTFSNNDGGTFVVDDLGAWSEAVVTIEAEAPSTPGAEILRGPVTADGADLAFALEVDIAGGASLWSPTDNATVTDNDQQGAWFMERVDDSGVAALTLASPAPGWSFAGWTQTQDRYLPMGTFSAPDAADSDCFFCGDNVDIGIPGEDFVADLPTALTDPIDLADGGSSVVIALSPDAYDLSPDAYDLSPDAYDITVGGPFRFAFDVLSLDVPQGQPGGQLMAFGSVLDPPSGGLTAAP